MGGQESALYDGVVVTFFSRHTRMYLHISQEHGDLDANGESKFDPYCQFRIYRRENLFCFQSVGNPDYFIQLDAHPDGRGKLWETHSSLILHNHGDDNISFKTSTMSHYPYSLSVKDNGRIERVEKMTHRCEFYVEIQGQEPVKTFASPVQEPQQYFASPPPAPQTFYVQQPQPVYMAPPPQVVYAAPPPPQVVYMAQPRVVYASPPPVTVIRTTNAPGPRHKYGFFVNPFSRPS